MAEWIHLLIKIVTIHQEIKVTGNMKDQGKKNCVHPSVYHNREEERGPNYLFAISLISAKG